MKRHYGKHASVDPDEPLRHPDHKRPVTRRDFLAQGFVGGVGTVLGTTALSMFANPRQAYATLADDLEALKTSCGIATQGAGKIPFICIDLAGGANVGGSNALVGGQGGQFDFLSTAGYDRLGLPGDMIPGVAEASNLQWGSREHSLQWVNEHLSGVTTFAVDGSQIFPSKDLSLPIALVQV
ncbi:MAG: hypothetical protein AAF420_09700, partial [Pseudomonadota bacterium]